MTHHDPGSSFPVATQGTKEATCLQSSAMPEDYLFRPLSVKFLIHTVNLFLSTRHKKMTFLEQEFVTKDAEKIGEGV